MDTKTNAKLFLVAVAVVIVSILLLGCISAPQQPAQPAQNPPSINARTGANVEPPTILPQEQTPAQKKYTCSLTLNPATIDAGSSTQIGFAVHSDANPSFTYNCGDEIREISTGGLTTGFRLCQFNSPGNVEVWIKADGTTCAQQTLTVQQAQIAKTCSIDQSSVQRDLTNYYYDAMVQFSGFSPQDELMWICDYTTATKKLGGGGAAGMPLYTNIYCDFTGQPVSGTIEVSIGNVSCGSISTR